MVVRAGKKKKRGGEERQWDEAGGGERGAMCGHGVTTSKLEGESRSLINKGEPSRRSKGGLRPSAKFNLNQIAP